MGNAYLQEEFSKAEAAISSISSKIGKAIQNKYQNVALNKGYVSTQEFFRKDLRGISGELMNSAIKRHHIDLHDEPVLPVSKRGTEILRDPLLNKGTGFPDS